jgi:hypothetical protein
MSVCPVSLGMSSLVTIFGRPSSRVGLESKTASYFAGQFGSFDAFLTVVNRLNNVNRFLEHLGL